MDNTTTFFVLILKEMRRLQNMYATNMRRFENEVLLVISLVSGRKLLEQLLK